MTHCRWPDPLDMESTEETPELEDIVMNKDQRWEENWDVEAQWLEASQTPDPPTLAGVIAEDALEMREKWHTCAWWPTDMELYLRLRTLWPAIISELSAFKPAIDAGEYTGAYALHCAVVPYRAMYNGEFEYLLERDARTV